MRKRKNEPFVSVPRAPRPARTERQREREREREKRREEGRKEGRREGSRAKRSF